MSVATGTAVALGVTAAAGVAGSAIAAHSQGSATDKAVNAEQTSAANSLAFNREVYANTTAQEQPFVNLGTAAAGELGSRLADGSLTSAYPGGAFHFSAADFQNDPAYQFNLSEGLKAEQRTAAAQGGLISGGALKEAAQYSQGLAGNQYQQSYQNALGAYQMAYNQFNDHQANEFARLYGVAGLGQNAVAQTGAAGAQAVGTAAGISGNAANTIAGLTTAQGNAAGAATMAGANAISGAGNSVANYLAQMQGSSYRNVMVPYTPTYPVDPRTGL